MEIRETIDVLNVMRRLKEKKFNAMHVNKTIILNVLIFILKMKSIGDVSNVEIKLKILT